MSENASIPKVREALQKYGLTYKGKAITDSQVKAFKVLTPFVGDEACEASYSVLEAICPEFRDSTLLMRVAQLCNGRYTSAASGAESDARARASLTYVFDCLRVAKLTGDVPKDEVYTVSKVSGQERKSSALVHTLFKKADLLEFIRHEAELLDSEMVGNVFTWPFAGRIINQVYAAPAPFSEV